MCDRAQSIASQIRPSTMYDKADETIRSRSMYSISHCIAFSQSIATFMCPSHRTSAASPTFQRLLRTSSILLVVSFAASQVVCSSRARPSYQDSYALASIVVLTSASTWIGCLADLRPSRLEAPLDFLVARNEDALLVSTDQLDLLIDPSVELVEACDDMPKI